MTRGFIIQGNIMKKLRRTAAISLATILLLPLVLSGCKDVESSKTVTVGYTSWWSMAESSQFDIVAQAFQDIIDYYNENDLIPGVHLNLLIYRGFTYPNNSAFYYDWLKDEGADIIFTPSYDQAQLMKPLVNEDMIPLFTLQAFNISDLNTPGYTFYINNPPELEAYTLLKWLADNDNQFPSTTPAKIGGIYCEGTYMEAFFKGMEEYASAHGNEYNWIGTFHSNSTNDWDYHIEALESCDYIIPPKGRMTDFIETYRDSGYNGKFVGLNRHQYSISDTNDLISCDDMLIIRPTRWWNETSEEVNLAEYLLHKNQLEVDANLPMWYYNPYLDIVEIEVMIEVISDAASRMGEGGSNSESIYEAAQSFVLTIDGIDRYSFGENKRAGANYYGIYQISAEEQNLVRIDPTWYPVVRQP